MEVTQRRQSPKPHPALGVQEASLQARFPSVVPAPSPESLRLPRERRLEAGGTEKERKE
jgi:hypothetical protein